MTEYEFDAAAWRARARRRGPAVLEVHVNTGGHVADWQRVPLAGDMLLRFSDDGPAGVSAGSCSRASARGSPSGIVTVEFRPR